MHSEPFVCPSCRETQFPANGLAAARLEAVRLCQGCRAQAVFRERPRLAPLFLEFWKTHGFPASPSWLAGLPSEHSPQ